MRYAALFRGLNVGGKNAVKMAELRELFIRAGYGDVKSVIQSGNLLFTAEGERSAIADTIRRLFTERFGFACGITLRTGEEIAETLDSIPFTQEEIATAEAANLNVTHLYIYLADEPVDIEMVNALQNVYTGPDRLCANGREIYLLCHQSVRDSKLAQSLEKLRLPITARNLNTLQKIDAILNQ